MGLPYRSARIILSAVKEKGAQDGTIDGTGRLKTVRGKRSKKRVRILDNWINAVFIKFRGFDRCYLSWKHRSTPVVRVRTGRAEGGWRALSHRKPCAGCSVVELRFVLMLSCGVVDTFEVLVQPTCLYCGRLFSGAVIWLMAKTMLVVL